MADRTEPLLAGARASGWVDLMAGAAFMLVPVATGATGAPLLVLLATGFAVAAVAAYEAWAATPRHEGDRGVAASSLFQMAAGLFAFGYAFAVPHREVTLAYRGFTMLAGLVLATSAGYSVFASLRWRVGHPPPTR